MNTYIYTPKLTAAYANVKPSAYAEIDFTWNTGYSLWQLTAHKIPVFLSCGVVTGTP